MGDVNGTVLGVLAAAIALSTILARVVEKLVDKALERRKNGHYRSKEGGHKKALELKSSTTDLALQAQTLNTVIEDLDEVKRIVYDNKAAMTKDLPHVLERMELKQSDILENGRDQLKELQELRRAIDNNTSATKALHNFLARQYDRD